MNPEFDNTPWPRPDVSSLLDFVEVGDDRRAEIGDLVDLADGRVAVYCGGGKAAVTVLPEPPLPESEQDRVRKDERHRLAELLDRDAATITEFLSDPAEAVRFVAQLLRLDQK